MCRNRHGDKAVAGCHKGIAFDALGGMAASNRCPSLAGSSVEVRGRD
jgi:hypothetical protein